MQEIYCDYCRGFRPFTTNELTITCDECGSIAARLNSHGQFKCDDCGGYREPVKEDLHKPLPEDHANRGWVVGDVCCPRCMGILLVIRAPDQQ